jgi:hypothetical protein
MNKQFLKDVLDAASSSRLQCQKPRETYRAKAIDPDLAVNTAVGMRRGPYCGMRFMASRIGSMAKQCSTSWA